MKLSCKWLPSSSCQWPVTPWCSGCFEGIWPLGTAWA